jgi:lipoyl-dependent peroxiredoxin subunit D
MGLQELRNQIPDFGRDIKLNLEALLSGESVPGLSPSQAAGIALASAYAVGHRELVQALKADLPLSPEIDYAAKGAAAIMAMNNVYYRTMHLLTDKDFSKLPARLRMNFIGKPGIPKVDFELMCLAISALAGCGACLNSHVEEAKKAGVPLEGLHATIRIASVVNAAMQVHSLLDR